jgi:centromere protein C
MIRKTGITIPQNARDEHGIEDLDGIFSSPEKAPPLKKSTQNGSRTLTSEDMQLAQSMLNRSGAMLGKLIEAL